MKEVLFFAESTEFSIAVVQGRLFTTTAKHLTLLDADGGEKRQMSEVFHPKPQFLKTAFVQRDDHGVDTVALRVS